MRLLLAAMLLGLARADQDGSLAAKVSGPWSTVNVASSDPALIQRGGVMRTHFRRMDCADAGCHVIFIEFYVEEAGVCQRYRVQGLQDARGVYSTVYKGQNFYHVVYLSTNAIIFYNEHVDENSTTRLLLAAARGNSLSQEEEEKYRELVREKNIPEENIERIIETDDCPR